jgi:ATP-binding cassette subfamily B protein
MPMYYRGRDYETTNNFRPYDQKLFTVMWAFARPFRGLLALAIVIMLMAASADLARPYLMKVAIDEYMAGKDVTGLTNVVYWYAASIVASAGLSYGQTLLLQSIGQRIIYNIRGKVFQRLMYQRFREMEKQAVGRMVTRVTNDTDAVKELYTDVLVAFASDVIILAGIVTVMLWMHWQLALVAFSIIPLMFLLAFLYQKYARQAYRLVREKTAEVNSFLQESLNGVSVIKAFYRFRQTTEEYRQVNKEYLTAGLREMRIFAFFRPLVDVLYVLSTIAVLGYGGWQFGESMLEIGVVVAFLRYVEKFFWPIKDLSEKYSLLQAALAAAERIYDLISVNQGEENSGWLSSLEQFRGDIRFENVWFAYDEEEWVLQDVTFQVGAGEFVGVAGPSGSGKTTIISLLLRFYEPQKGAIYLDGQDIRLLPLDLLRRQIGVVFQDVHLFKGTIRDNISLFDNSIPEERIITAAETANINDFIQSLAQQYDTQVGYHGSFLSAGQRQLISLARVLAWQSRILILDEATSSIDSATEQMIQNALDKITKVQTTLVVAHRLSTIRHADKIIVLSRGRIIEEGAHQELLERQGTYYRLYKSQ